MRTVWFALRAGFRGGWRPLLGLALLLGLMGGVALTAAAGARRTDTAYPRLLRLSRASDLLLTPARSGFKGYFAALARLPQVETISTTAYLQMNLPSPGGGVGPQVVGEASPDGATGIRVDRVKILSGRLFHPADPRAVMVDQQLAARERLRPGSTLHLIAIPQRGGSPLYSRAVPLAFRVSAVVAFDDQIVAPTTGSAAPRVLLSPAFARTAAARSFNPGSGAANIVLRPGASAAAFSRAAVALAARDRVGLVTIVHLATGYAATQRAIRPEAAALTLFAALAGVIGLALAVQLLSRQLFLDATEFPILRALGMTRPRLAMMSLARAASVTLSGGAIAVVSAIVASPLTPIGPARLAEPSPGIDVNLAVLVGGLAAVSVLPLLAVAPAAWRAARRAQGPLGVAEPVGPARTARLGPMLALAGSVPGSIGVRMAFEPGRGRTAVPVRSALTGVAVAVLAMVAAVVFGASLIGLVSTPHRYGQNWDEDLDLQAAGVPLAAAAPVLAKAPGLSQYAAGDYGQVSIRGTDVPAIGLDQIRGRGFLTLLAGRPPVGPHEIVLGARTLRALGAHLRQTVTVRANGRGMPMRIVGSAVFAAFSSGGLAATDLGTGAVVAAPVLSLPNPPVCTGHATCYSFFLLRFRPGTDLRAAAASLQRAVAAKGCPPGLCVVRTGQRPTDIQNYSGVRDTPLVLGAFLALLAVGTLAHVLLTAVRRRRRDLAVLKTLGLTARQVLAVVVWQACALTAAALVIGVPLGVVAGRWTWTAFAASAGAGAGADIPMLVVLAVIPAALATAGLIAAGPASAAARVRPAAALHTE